MIISIDAGKTFDKIQHYFMIKTLSKLGIVGEGLNLIKNITETLQLTLFLVVRNWMLSLLKSRTRQGLIFYHSTSY
jgi:hypothetical protein